MSGILWSIPKLEWRPNKEREVWEPFKINYVGKYLGLSSMNQAGSGEIINKESHDMIEIVIHIN